MEAKPTVRSRTFKRSMAFDSVGLSNFRSSSMISGESGGFIFLSSNSNVSFPGNETNQGQFPPKEPVGYPVHGLGTSTKPSGGMQQNWNSPTCVLIGTRRKRRPEPNGT